MRTVVRSSFLLTVLSIAIVGIALSAEASDTHGGPTRPRGFEWEPPEILPNFETEFGCKRRCDKDFANKKQKCRDQYCPDASVLAELCETLEGEEMFACFEKLEELEKECMARQPDMCDCFTSALQAWKVCYDACETRFKPRPLAPQPGQNS